ncbi:MAG: beta-propeller domain-containing protein, partial [Eubacteriales bacterium]|nr:beta-propeller domain-containing protein [Eubacteriales bacterium]
MRKLSLILLVLSLLLTLMSGCSAEPGTSSFEDQNLMFAGDYRSLIKLIGEQKADLRQYSIQMTGEAGVAAEDSADGAGSGETNDTDYSRTNLQVEGVDEADIIKTDGRYIYLINNGRLTIVDAANPADLRMASELSWASYETMASGSRGESPQELFIDSENQRLILLLSGYEQEISEVDGSDMTGATTAPGTDGGGSGSDGIETAVPDTDDGSGPVDLPAPDVIYVTRYRDYVTSIVFDISQPDAPAEVSRLSQEGSYLTS